MKPVKYLLCLAVLGSHNFVMAQDSTEGFRTNENAQFLDAVTDLKKQLFQVKNDRFPGIDALQDRYDKLNQDIKNWTQDWVAVKLYLVQNRQLPIRDLQKEVSDRVFGQFEKFHQIQLRGLELSDDLGRASSQLRNAKRSNLVPNVPGNDFKKNYDELVKATDSFAQLLENMQQTLDDNLIAISSSFSDLEVAFTQLVNTLYLGDGLARIAEAKLMIQKLFVSQSWYAPYASKLEELMISSNSHMVYKNALALRRVRNEVENACGKTKEAIRTSTDLDEYYRGDLTANLNALCTDFLTRVDDRMARWNFTNPGLESINFKKGLAKKKCEPGVIGSPGKVNCKAYAWASKITDAQISAMDSRKQANLEKLWWGLLLGRPLDAKALGLESAPL